MLLTEDEVQQAIEHVKEAFPRFGDWKYNNAVNESYAGFSLWGEFVLETMESVPRRFYITFDAYHTTWTGHLTIGQHAYFWSSADYGDADLIETSPCPTLEEAIMALKQQTADLLTALSGTTVVGGGLQ